MCEDKRGSAIVTNLQIAALVYGAVTLVYLIPTYIEGERAGGQWSAHRVAGLIFCLVWPLLTLVFIVKVMAGASKAEFVLVDPTAAIRTNPPRD